ncbi:MAG: acetyltransferase [Cryobacterium sp.]|nr:acetyltransferase [Cryobacterium sp.]
MERAKVRSQPIPAVRAKPTPSHPKSSESRFAGLDGLRAIAVLSVVAYHLFPGTTKGGYLGVDIFFVISGFLITALLLKQWNTLGRLKLVDFWRRRARRLLPALFVLLIVCASVAAIAGGNVLIDLGRQLLGASTFSSNWLATFSNHSYFTESNPELFRNLWSLAVEEQFYLLWPLALLLVVLIRKVWIRVALLGVVAVVSALGMAMLYIPGADATRVYYGTDTHSFGLALGASLALGSSVWLSRSSSWNRVARAAIQFSGVAAIAGIVLMTQLMADDSAFTYRGGLQLVAALSAIAIAGSVIPNSILGRWLDNPVFKWVGERSYGLYLWHWPVFVLVSAFAGSNSATNLWVVGIISLAISLGACGLSYTFVEQPIRKQGFRSTMRVWWTGWWDSLPKLLTGLASVCALAAGVYASSLALSAAPSKTDAQALIEAGAAALETPEVPTVPVKSNSNATPTSNSGILAGSQLTAIGDSVMLASAPSLLEAFPGISIDATVSRDMITGPALVGSLIGQDSLRQVLILGLGTNGPINFGELEKIHELIGPNRQLILISVQAPRYWTDGVNQILFKFAQKYRNVEIANWRDAIAAHLDLLARDQIHPGPTGGAIYAQAVKDALQRLAELPPLLSAKEYGLAPHPS